MIKLLLFIIFVYGIAVISALLFNAKLKREKFDGIHWKECFSPIKHLSFILGTIIAQIPWWVMDQYVMRFYDDNCRVCIEDGLCIDPDTKKSCGCNARKKVSSPFEVCKKGNFGKIIFNKEEALNHLNSIKYKIKVVYGEQQ